MSRFRRAVHGVVSSYVLLAATAVYSLASVPVAFHYLNKERFGLWVVMGTLVGYLSLIDAGMTSAAGRLLIDHKDARDGGHYGSLIKTGWIVSILQGVIILGIGLGLAGTLAGLLAIPAALQAEFIRLVNWQCIVLALSFATRILSLMLGAHQRMDWANYIGTISLLVNFTVQWVLFHCGFGVLSLAGGSLAALVATVAAQALACKILKLYPQSGGWGSFSWLHFRELFGFGKDVFLVSVGSQLIMASQITIITRLLGLEAAAAWSVGLRVYNLLSQIVWRISDMSWYALAEMMARGELARLRERYRSLAILSFSFAGWVAVSLALCNSRFVTLWVHGKILWPAGNDWLLAAWMIISTVVHCHIGFVLTSKQIGFMRYIYFIEGIVFVALSCLVARAGGLAAIIGCSVVCSSLFSGPYGVWRVSRYFGISFREVACNWLRPMAKMLLFYLPVAIIAWWLPLPVSDYLRLGINAALAGSFGALLFLRYGIPKVFQHELLQRNPAKAGFILKHIFVKSAD